MDLKTRRIIETAAAGRGYTLIRQVGNRIEVMFSGDYEVSIIEPAAEKPKAPPKASAEEAEVSAAPSSEPEAAAPPPPSKSKLNKQPVSYLRKMATGMGIESVGLKKSELIAAIIEELKGQQP